MNKKAFFEYILPQISPYLSDVGFTYLKSKDIFIRNTENGWIHILLSFYQFATTDNFNVGFELRDNNVQEILIKYIDQNTINHKTAPTLVFSLTRLLNQKDTQFSFNGEKELDELLVSKVLPFIRNTVPIFAERYLSLSNIYQLITNASEPNNYLVFKNYKNYITALIIGKLIFPHDFDSVVKTCDNLFLEIKKRAPTSYNVELYERNFHNIVEDLKKRVV